MAESPPVPGRTEPPRLPRSYTVGHERDANPSVGRVVLILLAVVCLGLQGAEFLFLPHANVARLIATAVRVGAAWTCFIAVAAGLGWARWPLAVVNVGLAIWLEVHAMMGTFAAAYPGFTLGSSLVPGLLGLFFLWSGGWLGLSADLTAYLDRQPERAVSKGSRLVTAGVLAVLLGVPAAGLMLLTALSTQRIGPSAVYQPAESFPVPPQNREGAEFARVLIERALREKDFNVVTASMSPELRAQTKPDWVQRTSAALARRGPPRGLEISDVFFNQSVDLSRDLTFCNVFAVYPEGGKVCFHCNLSRTAGKTDWQVDMVFIE